MKRNLRGLLGGFVLLAAFIFCGQIVDLISKDPKDHYERAVLELPDVVYENISLRLDDGFTAKDVLRYYSEHKSWCDSLVIYDYRTDADASWEEFWGIED